MSWMWTVMAILLIVIGAAYPIWAIWRLAVGMNRKERPLEMAQVVVALLLIAVVPLAAILGGFAGLVPSVWASTVLRMIIMIASGLTVGALIAQFWLARSSAQRKPNQSI